MSFDPSKKNIVVIGDGACGKTSLLVVYVVNKFPVEYIPTVFDNYTKEVLVDGTLTTTLLMDTSGQEDYERLRALQYHQADVFVLCFSVDSRASFENVTAKWMKEIKQLKVPIVLVATKTDLRGSIDLQQTAVTTPEGEMLAKRIKAFSYVECSAKLMSGVSKVFEEATRAALFTNKISIKRWCNLI